MRRFTAQELRDIDAQLRAQTTTPTSPDVQPPPTPVPSSSSSSYAQHAPPIVTAEAVSPPPAAAAPAPSPPLTVYDIANATTRNIDMRVPPLTIYDMLWAPVDFSGYMRRREACRQQEALLQANRERTLLEERHSKYRAAKAMLGQASYALQRTFLERHITPFLAKYGEVKSDEVFKQAFAELQRSPTFQEDRNELLSLLREEERAEMVIRINEAKLEPLRHAHAQLEQMFDAGVSMDTYVQTLDSVAKALNATSTITTDMEHINQVITRMQVSSERNPATAVLDTLTSIGGGLRSNEVVSAESRFDAMLRDAIAASRAPVASASSSVSTTATVAATVAATPTTRTPAMMQRLVGLPPAPAHVPRSSPPPPSPPSATTVNVHDDHDVTALTGRMSRINQWSAIRPSSSSSQPQPGRHDDDDDDDDDAYE